MYIGSGNTYRYIKKNIQKLVWRGMVYGCHWKPAKLWLWVKVGNVLTVVSKSSGTQAREQQGF